MPLPVAKKKFCCNGPHALLVAPLWPMKRRGKKFFMALYQCKSCNEYSLRGENQERMWNTFVQILNEKQANDYINRGRAFKARGKKEKR